MTKLAHDAETVTLTTSSSCITVNLLHLRVQITKKITENHATIKLEMMMVWVMWPKWTPFFGGFLWPAMHGYVD